MNNTVISFFLLFVIGVHVRAEVPETIVQTVSDGSNTYTLRMAKESLRGPHFNVKVQNSTGGYDDYSPGEVRTYMGTVDELDDALVSGYLQTDGQLWARIYLDRGNLWTTLGESVTWKSSINPSYSFSTTPTVAAGQAGQTVYQYEMAIDVDYDCFTLRYSSNLEKTVEMIEKNMSAWKAVQLRDNMMIPYLGRLLVRGSQAHCPFQGISGTALLRPFATEWQTNQSDAMAYCFKTMLATPNIGGGVAYSPGAYNVSQCKSTGWFMGAGRHELGHNFGCADYEGGSPEGPTINCGNGIARFCGPSVRDHLLHRNKSIGTKLYSIGGAYATVDVPPYAALDLVHITCDIGQRQQVVIDVTANDFDANADDVTILSFEATSNLGYAITRSEGTGPEGRDQLVYVFEDDTSLDRFDYFHYTIQDSHGKTATGLVTVKVGITIPPIWTIETDGDAFVQGTTTTNYGSSSSLVIKRSTAGAGSIYTRTGWVHFTLPNRPVTGSAALTFTLDGADINSGTMTVWGVNDGKVGDAYGTDWSEQTITGSNALYRPDFTQGENIAKIGTFACSSTQKTFTLSNSTLVDFLKADTNGGVTFMLTRNVNDGNFSLRSREHADGGAATLSMALVPPADAYVRSGIYADDNFGYENRLIVKDDPGTSYDRHTILRFDYNNQGTGQVNNALLTVTPLSAQPAATLRIRLAEDRSDTWSENLVTWNSEPVCSSSEVTFAGSDLVIGRSFSVDVAALLAQAGNVNGIATFVIDSLTPVQDSYTSFASREHETTDWRPRLQVQMSNMFSDGDINLDNRVDLEDFALLVSSWLNDNCDLSMACFGADLDTDGSVNTVDLHVMTENWLN